MHYHQNSSIKTSHPPKPHESPTQVQKIVFHKQITQQWKVKTDNPKQILPFLLKKLALSTVCEFWHQLKFLYFQNGPNQLQTDVNYSNIEKRIQTPSRIKAWIDEPSQQQPGMKIEHSIQGVEMTKKMIKAMWKITRPKLLSALIRLKEEAGIDDQSSFSSLQLEDENLNSYMRFLKLQENKKIDIAIENLDSVVQKNIRRKLLNAFLNIHQRLRNAKKTQTYRDRIKVDCFVDIVIRNIRRMNFQLIQQSFCLLNHRSNSRQSQQLNESARRQTRKAKIDEEQSSKILSNQHFRSISNKKSLPNEEQTLQKRDTINKVSRKIVEIDQKQIKNMTNTQTIKRQVQNQKQKIAEDFHQDHSIQFQKNTALAETPPNTNTFTGSKLENIFSSHYYKDSYTEYIDQKPEQSQKDGKPAGQLRINLNGLSTARGTHSLSHSQKSTQYQISGLHNNIDSQTFEKPTTRTPVRSQLKQQTYSHQLENRSVSKNIIKNAESQYLTNSNQEVHLPITQRIQKNYYQRHEEEENEPEQDDEGSLASDNVQQQICVIRNFATTPQRQPDRYEKIPILSKNIQFRQFFLTQKKKTAPKHAQLYSASYYQRKSCQGCEYCLKLQKVTQLMQKVSIGKDDLITRIDKDEDSDLQIKTENKNIKQLQIFSQGKFTQSKELLEITEFQNIEQTHQTNSNPGTVLLRNDFKQHKQKLSDLHSFDQHTAYQKSARKQNNSESQLAENQKSLGLNQSRSSKPGMERKIFVRKPMY